MRPPPKGLARPRLAPRLVPEQGTPIYVHVPFCVRKCTYCDFYSVPSLNQDIVGGVATLEREIERRAPRHPRTVFVGGGTPTLLDERSLESLFTTLQRCTEFRSSAHEVTVECNPESLTPGKARLLKELGANRLSIGFQSLDPDVLQLFDRAHSVEQSFLAFDSARQAGFSRINIDLIFATPGQSLGAWSAALERVLGLHPDHVSAYDLAFEEGTLITRWQAEGRVQRLSEEVELEMFWSTRRTLAAEGLDAYEVSNYARQGQQCAHNVNYWRNGPYLGVGPSAVSKVDHTRFGNPRSIEAWRAAVEAETFPAQWEETLSPSERLGETWWLGLRTHEGVDPQRARRVAGFDLEEDPAAALAGALAAQGWLESAGNGALRLSERGLPVADALSAQFLDVCSRPPLVARGAKVEDARA